MNQEVVGRTVSLLTFVVVAIAVSFYSYGRWDHNMARAYAVHPGWKIRQGAVLYQHQPNYGETPPEVASVVSFTDYYGHSRQVTLDLNETAQPVHHTQVDVGQDGSIYAPASYNESYAASNWTFRGPQAAVTRFWPASGILVFGVVGNLILSLILGLSAYFVAGIMPVPSLRGRLGTR